MLGHKRHLSSLKEALLSENKALHVKEKLKASSGLTWVNMNLYSVPAQRHYAMLGKNIIFQIFIYTYILTCDLVLNTTACQKCIDILSVKSFYHRREMSFLTLLLLDLHKVWQISHSIQLQGFRKFR